SGSMPRILLSCPADSDTENVMRAYLISDDVRASPRYKRNRLTRKVLRKPSCPANLRNARRCASRVSVYWLNPTDCFLMSPGRLAPFELARGRSSSRKTRDGAQVS